MLRNKKIKLTIPKPCFEDWNEMTPEGKNKYCSQCCNTITDFSTYTDRELLEYFSKTKGDTCGRFNIAQLNHLLVANEPSHTPIFRRLLFGTALAAGVAGTAQGQNINEKSRVSDSVKGTLDTTIHVEDISIPEIYKPVTFEGNVRASDKFKPTEFTYTIKGIAIDSNNMEPMPFANILIEEGEKQMAGVASDENGKFEITFDKEMLGKNLTIRAVYMGYYDFKENFILTNSRFTNFTIFMQPYKHADSANMIHMVGYVIPIIQR